MFARRSLKSTSSVLGAALIGGGVAYAGYNYSKNKQLTPFSSAYAESPDTKTAPPKTFKGGFPGFIDLRLESVEVVNHNVKRLRFKLPDENAVSGLSTICK